MVNRFTIFIFFASILLSFSYGILTIKYKIFPYELLKSIKNVIDPTVKYSEYYQFKKSFFEQERDLHYDIVFIGDSLTDEAEWQELFPGYRVANRGISGDRSDGVLNRLDAILSMSGAKTFVMIGINDLVAGNTVNTVFENYTKIVNQLIENNFKVYIQSTLYIREPDHQVNRKVTKLNALLMQLSAEHESVMFIDLNAGMAPENYLAPEFSRNAIHLNAAGYNQWKQLITPYVNESSFRITDSVRQ